MQIELINNNDVAEKSLLIEQQEFINLFFPASLQVIELPRMNNIQYIFTLPNFALGIRDIEYSMVKELSGTVPAYHQAYDSSVIIHHGDKKYYPTENKFTANFDSELKNTLKLVGDVKGTLTLEVSVNIGIDNTVLAMSKMGYGQPSYIPKLYWYYIIDSKVNKISPLRYKNWSDGIDKNNMTFGYIDGEAP